MLGTHTNAYKNIDSLSKPFKHINRNLDIINLGSTIAYYDFDYNIMKKQGANLALPPQTLYYDFQILQQYSCCLKEGATVCICLFFFSFLVLNYEKDNYNFKYYNILDSNRIIDFTHNKKVLWNNAPALLFPELFKRIIKDAPLTDRDTENQFISDSHDKSNALRWMDGWQKQFEWNEEYVVNENQKKTMQQVTNILTEMLEYCYNKKLNPVIVIPPISNNLKKLIPENLINQCFWSNLYKAVPDKVTILDYMKNEYMCQSMYYVNALCMNMDGKTIFNRQLANDLFG